MTEENHSGYQFNNPFLIETEGRIFYHSGKNLIIYDQGSETSQIIAEPNLNTNQFVWLFGKSSSGLVLGIIASAEASDEHSLIAYEYDFGTGQLSNRLILPLGVQNKVYAASINQFDTVVLAGFVSGSGNNYFSFGPEAIVANGDLTQNISLINNGNILQVVGVGYYGDSFYFLGQTASANHLFVDSAGEYFLIAEVPSLPPYSPIPMVVHDDKLFLVGGDRLYYNERQVNEAFSTMLGDGSADFSLPTTTAERLISSIVSGGNELFIGYEVVDDNEVVAESFAINSPITYLTTPFSSPVQAITIDGTPGESDPYLEGSGNPGGSTDIGADGSAGSGGFATGPFTISSFRTDLTTLVAPPEHNRKYLVLALFWEAEALHWFIYGDSTYSNATDNYGRNRIFYYKSEISGNSFQMILQSHEISEVVSANHASIIPTPNGTALTFIGRRQLSYGGPIDDSRRYVMEINRNNGLATLHSRFEADDLAGNGSLGSGQKVLAILGNKMFTDNGIGGSNATGSYLWNLLAGLEIIPIKNSVTPGYPIYENYYVGSSNYVEANNVVERNEPYNVWGDDGAVLRENAEQTVRIYAVDREGNSSTLYEYVPTFVSGKPDIYRAVSETGAEYLRIEGSRCDANGVNCPVEDQTNFTRLYFRSSATADWIFVDDMYTQTQTANPTKIIQDLSQSLSLSDALAQFDNFGNLVRWDRNDWWFYKPGHGYGINLVDMMFPGEAVAPYEHASSYGVAATPYGIAVVAGRRFNGLFQTTPSLFFIQS